MMERIPAAITILGLVFGLAFPVQAPAQGNKITCPAPPEPVAGLSYGSRYDTKDTSRSRIDIDGKSEAEIALKPIDAFIASLADQSDQLFLTEPVGSERKQAVADCILRQISHWAMDDALSRLGSDVAQMTMGSRFSAFAIITQRTKPFARDTRSLEIVEEWLHRRILAQMTFWETGPDGARQGNLRAWSALSAAVTSDLTGDPVLSGWAAWSLRYILCSASEDGSLPQEMRRGRLALHYQLHAVAPLVAATRVLQRQGIDLTDTCGNAISRAARFAISDLNDGARTRGITGEVQSLFEGPRGLQKFQLAWLEDYLVLFPKAGQTIRELAQIHRPFSYSKLGGLQTLPEKPSEPGTTKLP